MKKLIVSDENIREMMSKKCRATKVHGSLIHSMLIFITVLIQYSFDIQILTKFKVVQPSS